MVLIFPHFCIIFRYSKTYVLGAYSPYTKHSLISRYQEEFGRTALQADAIFDRCLVHLYTHLFKGWHMSYLHYLCLLAHSRVQQILCCVFVLFVFVLCAQCCQFLWIVHSWLLLRFPQTFICSCYSLVFSWWCFLLLWLCFPSARIWMIVAWFVAGMSSSILIVWNVFGCAWRNILFNLLYQSPILFIVCGHSESKLFHVERLEPSAKFGERCKNSLKILKGVIRIR